jgi:outer membrane protein assembly factor BamE (lipoprotein component of BamABCDE complex)
VRLPSVRTALPKLPRVACLTLLCLTAVSVSGCGMFSVFDPTVRQHGALVDPDALRELIPGTSSRADVVSLIGSPTARATFDDNTWIYVSQTTATRIGRTPGVDKQKVVILTFDQNGVLRSIGHRDLADSKPIAMAAGATPSPGSEASFLQQLFGNVGKFTPAGLGGMGGGPGGIGSTPASQQPGYSGNAIR